MRRLKYISIGCLLTIVLYTNWLVRHTAYPRTYIAGQLVSGKTEKDLNKFLTQAKNSTLRLVVQDRVYNYMYADLGVIIREPVATEQIFAPNRERFPYYLIGFLKSFFVRRDLRPPIEFSDAYFQWLDTHIYDFSLASDSVLVDNLAQEFLFQENSEHYSLDQGSLTNRLLETFGQTDLTIKPVAVRLPNPQKEALIRLNSQLPILWQSPIIIRLTGSKKNLDLALSVNEIKQLVRLELPGRGSEALIDVDQKQLAAQVEEKLRQNKLPIGKSLPTPLIYQRLVKLLRTRWEGKAYSNTLTLALADTKSTLSPKVLGTQTDKRLEVDLGKQRMYLYSGETLFKTYKISSGLEYPTPTGQFSIQNKSPLAYSGIYDVWMPYWMEFTFRKDVNATLGIHELPYRLTDEGQRRTPPVQVIGAPYTGGCIALEPGAAREVFQFADVGTPLVIN